MSDLISGEKLLETIALAMPSHTSVNIISAFVSTTAIDWLSNNISEHDVCIVGRFIPKDFIDGASHIEGLKQALEFGASIKALPNLHAKIYQLGEDIIYTGSANFTGKGLALVENDNLEACTKVIPSDSTKAFINKIIDSAVDIDSDTLHKMDLFISELPEIDMSVEWPEDILPKCGDIFVSDFPLAMPGQKHHLYEANPALEFSIVENNSGDFNLAKKYFKKTKAYRWFKKTLESNESDRDLGFGQVSTLLHNALCDDPSPYRREIKDIQANLYKYVELYASDEIEIWIPGRRSQVARLVS